MYFVLKFAIPSKGGITDYKYILDKWIHLNIILYFIPSSEFNAYLKQIKVVLSAVKKYRIFSLVTITIYIFSL